MRLFYFLLILLIFPAFVQAQVIDVPQTQRVVIVKKTADWCPYCGQWGWTLFGQLLADNADRATVLAAHYSGGLSNSVSQNIATNLEGPSQPRFYVDNMDMNANSSNGATVRTNINARVEAVAQQSPVVQTGIRATYSGTQLFIHTNTRLFQDWNQGELYLGTYLVERTFISGQAGQSSNAEHKQLLRSVVRGAWYGVSVLSEATSAGFTVEAQDTVALGNLSPDNLEIVTILWRRNGDTYEVVNTNSTREITEAVVVSVANNEVFQGVSWTITSSPISDSSKALLNLTEAHKWVNISLYSMNGQYLTSLYDGALGVGMYEFPLSRLLGLPSGVYVLTLKVDGQINSQKIIFP